VRKRKYLAHGRLCWPAPAVGNQKIDVSIKLYKRLKIRAEVAVKESKMKLHVFHIVTLLASLYVADVSLQVIVEVPGYGVLNGTIETSSFTDRTFYAFRSVHYAETPTPENRYLVRNYKLQTRNNFAYAYVCNYTFIATNSKSTISYG
jgi:hypothetical protein